MGSCDRCEFSETTGSPVCNPTGRESCLPFLIYINDLPNASGVFEFISFADDTDLFKTIEYSIPITRTNLVDAKQAHVEYYEDQIYGLSSYLKRDNRVDFHQRN